jgi:uncharacterized protein YyaL (SSP411 family)
MRRMTGAGAVLAAGLAGVALLAGCGPAGTAVRPADLSAGQLRASVADGYLFLDQMMDRYASGSVPRLVQSFAGGALGQQGFVASETYDDAVVIDAYLAAGSRAGTARAAVIGNGLLYVQAHDAQHDGRIRAAYAPTPLRRPADVTVADPASLAGNMAWAGQALTRLYVATGRKAYLSAAEAIGNWVQAHCRDTRGAGGYTGGEDAGGQKIEWKSTEHNIDLYALFSMLAAATRDPAWSARAAWARYFVASMWDPQPGRFYVGTTTDGFTPNDQFMAEDVNSWSYLALRDPRYGASVSWDAANLAVSAAGYPGLSSCREDRAGIWYEGTAHLADALEFRGAPGDAARARQYLATLAHAQSGGPGHRGIAAASRNGLSDCDGGTYSDSLHTGTTAWYILAARKVDPFAVMSPARPAASAAPAN